MSSPQLPLVVVFRRQIAKEHHGWVYILVSTLGLTFARQEVVDQREALVAFGDAMVGPLFLPGHVES